MKSFKLPDLGEGLPEAEIHEWHVKEGDHVTLDQPLVSMETAKAVVEVPSPQTGRITKLCGKPGDIIETGAVLVEFEGRETEVAKDSGTVVGAIESSHQILVESPTGVTKKEHIASIKATPAVRMLAKAMRVDLKEVPGTGPGGSITADDIQKYLANETVSQTNTGKAELQGWRRSMAQVMAKSQKEVASATLMEDADIHKWLEKTDVTLRLVQAVIEACKAEPHLNAHFDGARLQHTLQKQIHLALAIDTPNGLYAPVIRDVGGKSLTTLRDSVNTLKQKAKTQAFLPADLQDATITLSNFGTLAGRYAIPMVVSPMVAIIAIGKKRSIPLVCDEEVAIHPILPISLSFDHRVVTGGEGARFLAAFIESLEKAE